MNSFEQRHQNDVFGLELINDFGWLRTAELARLMWPNNSYSRTRTDRVARGWIQRRLVIARALPDGAGRALVLSEAGAKLLRDEGIVAASGKDIGETQGGIWIAPSNWRHDLIAAGVLSYLYAVGYEILPERKIRRLNPSLLKIPDGLVWGSGNPQEAYWLEVENARKSGKAMQELANALIVVGDGQGPTLNGIKPTQGMVAFVPAAKDERVYALNHRLRVTQGIQRAARNDVSIAWAICTLLGCGVSSIKLVSEQIPSDRSLHILKILYASGWFQDERGVFVAHYNGRRLYVWEDDVMGWSFNMDEEPAGQADSKSDAMLQCARLLSELH